MNVSALLIAPVAVGIAYLLVMLRRLEQKALDYHKRADHAQRMMEGAKMDADEWQQRCAYISEQARLERERCQCQPKP